MLQVGLLNKTSDLIRSMLPFPQRFASLNIAIAGFRGVRYNTKGDQVVSLRVLFRNSDGVVEDLLIINNMVRRQN